MVPWVRSSLETRGPTTSTRRYSTSSPSAPRTRCTACCCASSPPGCCAMRIKHVGRPAELLQLNLDQVELGQGRAHLGEVGLPALDLDLDQRAAAEIDAEIEPMKEVERDRDDRQHRRERKADPPELDEVEVGVVRDDAEGKEAHGRSRS